MTENTITAALSPARLATLPREALVRLALKLDAVVTGANGAAYLALADVLDEPLGMPSGMLRAVGAFLLVFSLGVWLVATRQAVRPGAVAAVIAANLLWVVESLALVAFDWFSPATAGAVWVVLQALVVGGFAALQVRGLRRPALDSAA
jgi:hypothetical protein